MSHVRNRPLTEEELLYYRPLLGKPPTFNNEDAERFEVMFRLLVKDLQVWDFASYDLVFEYAWNAWQIRFCSIQAATAIKCHVSNNLLEEVLTAKAEQVRAKAHELGRSPAEVAHLVDPNFRVNGTTLHLSVIPPMRKPTENDYNRALEKTAPLQDHLERRINNATRWRDDAYGLLEMHRAGYGREVQAITDKILDAEFKEVNDSPGNQVSVQSETDGDTTTEIVPETTTEITPETTTEIVSETTTGTTPETTTEIVPETTTEIIPEGTTETIPELPTETNFQPPDNAAARLSRDRHDVEPQNFGDPAQQSQRLRTS